MTEALIAAFQQIIQSPWDANAMLYVDDHFVSEGLGLEGITAMFSDLAQFDLIASPEQRLVLMIDHMSQHTAAERAGCCDPLRRIAAAHVVLFELTHPGEDFPMNSDGWSVVCSPPIIATT